MWNICFCPHLLLYFVIDLHLHASIYIKKLYLNIITTFADKNYKISEELPEIRKKYLLLFASYRSSLNRFPKLPIYFCRVSKLTPFCPAGQLKFCDISYVIYFVEKPKYLGPSQFDAILISRRQQVVKSNVKPLASKRFHKNKFLYEQMRWCIYKLHSLDRFYLTWLGNLTSF